MTDTKKKQAEMSAAIKKKFKAAKIVANTQKGSMMNKVIEMEKDLLTRTRR
ncbi:MAG: hypothetical protein ACI93R_001056 [Flavobacteriales bacterium]|jgi:hypothetical protein